MTRTDRDGVLLPIVLAALLVLATLGTALHFVRQQSYRNLGKLDGFLRVVSVGEACHTRIVSRLQVVRWDDRWFKGRPDLGNGTWEDGSYRYLLADGIRPLEADLLVKARIEKTEVAMYWRLRPDPFTATPYRRIRTSIFSFTDPGAPETPAGLTAIGQRAEQSLNRRKRNHTWQQKVEQRILDNPRPGQIPRSLGLPPRLPPEEIPPPTTPGQPSPVDVRLTNPEPPPVPVPPFPPPNTAGVAPMGTLRELLTARESVLQSRRKVGNAENSLRLARDMLGQLRADLARCCRASPPPDPGCTSTDQSWCGQCQGALDGAGSIFDSADPGLSRDIAECKKSLDDIGDQIDQAAGPPSPSSATAGGLIQQASGAQTCADDVCGAVSSLLSRMNAAVGASLAACTGGGADGFRVPAPGGCH